MKKSILVMSAVLASFVGMSTVSTASVATPDTSGFCTREYDPVVYKTKKGKRIIAPNPCIAELWKKQGL
ncbi:MULTISPECIES: hypothetical protein [unclassified Acinetobacter]|uniref:hypothetical protein n=1 Tax=unclassified Acinetobacter TaxID=196816 RepID=UPI0035B79DA3